MEFEAHYGLFEFLYVPIDQPVKHDGINVLTMAQMFTREEHAEAAVDPRVFEMLIWRWNNPDIPHLWFKSRYDCMGIVGGPLNISLWL